MPIALPTVEIATVADLPAIRALRLAQGWSATDEVVRAVMDWERGRVFVIRASALAAASEVAQPGAHQALVDQQRAVADMTDVAHATDVAHMARVAGAPVVVIGAIAAGLVGVIGSVIVRDDYQRRGLGRAIMGYALDWLRAMGVRAVYLDATPAGRPLYSSLGFESMGARSWFTLTPLAAIDHAALARHAEGLRAASVDTTDADAVTTALTRLAPLDGAAFGGDRMALIAALVQRPNHHLYVVDDAFGAPAGYLVAYPTGERYQGWRVGPWVATRQAAAAATLLAALQSADDWLPLSATAPTARPTPPALLPSPRGGGIGDVGAPQMVLSLPGTNPHTLDLLRSIGCELVLDDLMMRLDLDATSAARATSASANGEDAPLHVGADMTRAGPPSSTAARVDGGPALVYAWMASMVF